MTVRHIVARMQALDLEGNPAPGAKLRFYDATTTTPRTVYSDSGRTTAILQPIEADDAGLFVQIYVQDGAYKYTVHSSADVLLETDDNVDPGFGTGTGPLSIAAGGTSASTAAGARSALGAASQVALDALDTRVADAETLLDNPILADTVAQTYAASFTPDFTADETRSVTLTGNITINAPTVTQGQKIRLVLIQDATGSRTWSVNAAFKWPGGYVPPLSTTASAVDVLEGFARTTSIIEVTSFKRQDVLGNIAIFEDQKTANTGGGTFTSGADRTRDLNTEVTDLQGFASVSSNQIALAAGTYMIRWSAPAFSVANHQSFLYNATDASEVKRGTSEKSDTTNSHTTRSVGSTVVVITSSKAFEIRHRCSSTFATNGFGAPDNLGTEVYTRVEIERKG